ncbi:MAG: SMC-Scp complex subunit ScpB [candidate division WOR-3 bacterium]
MEIDKSIKKAIEALLFASAEPLSTKRIAGVLGCSNSVVEQALVLLEREYEETERAFTVKKVNKGYKLFTRPEFSEIIKEVTGRKELYLSRAALTTLAIIAYEQPITRREIDRIRGVDSSGVINTLMDAGLVKVVGKEESFGHPFLYGTTNKFLETFHLNSIKDLPPLEDEDSAFSIKSGSEF